MLPKSCLQLLLETPESKVTLYGSKVYHESTSVSWRAPNVTSGLCMLMRKVQRAHAATWSFIEAFPPLLLSCESVSGLSTNLDGEVQDTNKRDVFLMADSQT